MPFAKITGSGSALPTNCVSNDVLSKQLAQKGIETSDEWIVSRTGIKQRYIASDDIKTSDLAVQAARCAIEDAGIAADKIDLIIVATSTPDYIFPSTACMVQSKLGIAGGAAFDVQAVCSGFVYALTTADAYIRAGNARCALVIGAETFSRIIDWNDRGTCVLFGDGAGAMILQASDKPGILASQLNADGSLHTILHTEGAVHHGQVVGDPFLRMDGQAVFKKAVTSLEASALAVCEKAGIAPTDIDWMVPHQANVRIIHSLGRKLGLSEDKVVITVDSHANTSAASVPLAFDVARKDGRIQAGHKVLLQGVGGGFTWGSVLVQV
ncbi:beta-ketoacyl-ACP synthase III [Pelistega europaea]|uniref:Beta-ketoacyl-[acyl-carrier-protein] synthase III n=1 Tax=Pelistega europaea TaxID=106147 RepID=A0A7Y4P4R4_9BURK|nr:beta-ketoacyl-ACP synthase III [Pelistega europaea]NOL49771.1 ketoacyl-ACP synthase III [Pelistega europaea]